VRRVSFSKILELCVKPMWFYLDVGHGVLTDRQVKQIMMRTYARMRQYVTPRRRERTCPRAVRQPIQAWPRVLRAQSITGPMRMQLI
jgi:hypothetical protein